MNGAQALFQTLVQAGIDTCFANPGTTEMWLVHEMGLNQSIRPILCLHENVATGAADGFARMLGRPALTLLHVGCGLSNGLANLHNAARAHTPLVNLVGANATYHVCHQPELEFIGRSVVQVAEASSHWAEESKSADDLARLGSLAVQHSTSGAGKVCTLVAPCNHLWEESNRVPAPRSPEPAPRVTAEEIERAAAVIGTGKATALILGSHALEEEALEVAGRIPGVELFGETYVSSHQARGEGRVPVTWVPYLPEPARAAFGRFEQVILVGTRVPMSTMAYQGKTLEKLPHGAEVFTLAGVEQDLLAALHDLAAALNAPEQPSRRQPRDHFPAPTGPLTAAAIGQTISIASPEDFILVDEGATASFEASAFTRGARRHDYLFAPAGAAIGAGMPCALGAAIACPDRKVVNLQADGSAMYTPMTLWTMAREGTDVTVILLKNNAYGILQVELARVREGEASPRMNSMLELTNPTLDWVSIAEGMGVPAASAHTAEEFFEEYSRAMDSPGPRLIEANLVQDFGPLIELVRQGRAERS